ncbi:MAG: hypothetical protein PHW04_11775 [Candidatus Wallbacteria bacterium]|nr:hypothetical protein [Candidatus Wallbacteria bacterium]
MKKALSLLFLLPFCYSLLAADEKPYTSLVIDAQQLELERSESPKILSEKGYEVYGTIFDNLDKALEAGVFFYAPTLDEAKKYDAKRIGLNPLFIKAKSSSGVVKTDLVVSDLDALKILKENKKSHFLDQFKVIVLVSKPTASE